MFYLDAFVSLISCYFSEIKEGQVRCGEHSDYGTLTLLFQDLVGGLEVIKTCFSGVYSDHDVRPFVCCAVRSSVR